MCLFFFFKQKTAYEMRISDWSSDVCSSDLIRSGAGNPMENTQGSIAIEFRQGWGWLVLAALTISTIGDEITLLTLMFRTAESARAYGVPALLIAELLPGLRSEEHTSELQSLMRISYAVFCLKKKKTHQIDKAN